jgi:hypothetical protein
MNKKTKNKSSCKKKKKDVFYLKCEVKEKVSQHLSCLQVGHALVIVTFTALIVVLHFYRKFLKTQNPLMSKEMSHSQGKIEEVDSHPVWWLLHPLKRPKRNWTKSPLSPVLDPRPKWKMT